MNGESNQVQSSKRLLKVYHGSFQLRHRHAYKRHPVIRFGGVYLSAVDFQIGDSIEIAIEKGKIVITKVSQSV